MQLFLQGQGTKKDVEAGLRQIRKAAEQVTCCIYLNKGVVQHEFLV